MVLDNVATLDPELLAIVVELPPHILLSELRHLHTPDLRGNMPIYYSTRGDDAAHYDTILYRDGSGSVGMLKPRWLVVVVLWYVRRSLYPGGCSAGCRRSSTSRMASRMVFCPSAAPTSLKAPLQWE